MKPLRKVGKGERRICGVCGGLSKYINPNIDPFIIRMLWVIVSLFSPIGMTIVYFALAILLKTETEAITA